METAELDRLMSEFRHELYRRAPELRGRLRVETAIDQLRHFLGAASLMPRDDEWVEENCPTCNRTVYSQGR